MWLLLFVGHACAHARVQVKAKYSSGTMVDVFRETFCWLPLAFCINSEYFQ